jgi:heme/copper-type cytochrome/quinol oxidase subunit 3
MHVKTLKFLRFVYRVVSCLSRNTFREQMEVKEDDIGPLEPRKVKRDPEEYYSNNEDVIQKYANKVIYNDDRMKDFKDYLYDNDVFKLYMITKLIKYWKYLIYLTYMLDTLFYLKYYDIKKHIEELPIEKEDNTINFTHYHPFHIVGQSLLPFFTVFFFSFFLFFGIALLKWDTIWFEETVFKYIGICNIYPINYILYICRECNYLTSIINIIFNNNYTLRLFFNSSKVWKDPFIYHIFILLNDIYFYTVLRGDFYTEIRDYMLLFNLDILAKDGTVDKKKLKSLRALQLIKNLMLDAYFDFRLSPKTPLMLLSHTDFIYQKGYTLRESPFLIFYSINKVLYAYVYNRFSFDNRTIFSMPFYIIGYITNFFIPILYIYIKVRFLDGVISPILNCTSTLQFVKFICISSFISFVFVVSYWIYQVTCIESINRTTDVDLNLRLGLSIFIVSEIMLFFSFFWAFFHSALNPSIFTVVWPPIGTPILSVYGIPLANTIILITSGITLTIAHLNYLNLQSGAARLFYPERLAMPVLDKPLPTFGVYPRLMALDPSECDPYKGEEPNYTRKFIFYLLLTLALGGCFITLQAIEYMTIPLNINDGIFGSLFFFLTGFHGFHVLLGICFLFFVFIFYVDLLYEPPHEARPRFIFFDFAVWYWHFVDVVWLVLYIFVYYWSFTII